MLTFRFHCRLQSPATRKVANRLCNCSNIAKLSETSAGKRFWGCPDEKCTYMEWASSNATQPQSNSLEPSEYVGSVGRSREADVCFKVRRNRVDYSPALNSATVVQSDRSLGIR